MLIGVPIIAAVIFVTRKVTWYGSDPPPPPHGSRHPPGRLLTAGARNHQSIRRLIQLSLTPVSPIGAGKDNSRSSNRHEFPAAVNHGE